MPLQGTVIHLSAQLPDRRVEFYQREESPVAQTGQNPALHDLDGHLGLGLILGFIGPGREDGSAVMVGQLGIGGIDLRRVAVGSRNSRLEIIRH